MQKMEYKIHNKRENKAKISFISYIQIIEFIWSYFWNAAVVEINGIFSALLDKSMKIKY